MTADDSDVVKIAKMQISQSEVDNNIQYFRIQNSLLLMKSKRFKRISYHGKMRKADVDQLENIRKHFRSKMKTSFIKATD
jgi:hypothetical protein